MTKIICDESDGLPPGLTIVCGSRTIHHFTLMKGETRIAQFDSSGRAIAFASESVPFHVAVEAIAEDFRAILAKRQKAEDAAIKAKQRTEAQALELDALRAMGLDP